MRLLCAVMIFVVATISMQGQRIASGPMVGHATMREVKVWVQTDKSADIVMEYFSDSLPQKKYRTEPSRTTKEKAYSTILIADSVQPGNRYSYSIFLNGKLYNLPYKTTFQTPPLWQWRGNPPDFTVALGSCLYVNEPRYDRPGKPYGSDYDIFSIIHNQQPTLMLWLGDNTYLREADWDSRTGIFHRYSHTRALPEMQPLLASTHHYAIWDDHDYGPNDSDKGFYNKNITFDAFTTFWANPGYGFDDKKCITSTFEWGDVQFFLLDNRSFRTANKRETGKSEILGDDQIEWLLHNLASSKATFKIIAIGGQTISSAAIFENFATRPEERKKLLDGIEKENIKGVFFLSGDRHFTELSKMNRALKYPLYDLTCSPLTSGIHKKAFEENNMYRETETLVMDHNFAILSFSGDIKNRLMRITVYNAQGKKKWATTISSNDLQ